MNKAFREVCSLGRRAGKIKEMMEEGRWLSASCGLRIIQQKHTEETVKDSSQVERESVVAGEALIRRLTAMMLQWWIICLGSLIEC